ncbi:Hyalin [Holothuria leucospilota]|uniref:Hyalin n=1 Tax=Holothuria leucospilota TaxID=206669 RepID=A0A9Q1BZS5_HOLLE|nr:Hyalin [Holothuria leucospilota]
MVTDATSPTAICPATLLVNATYDGNTKPLVEWDPATCSDNSQDVKLNCSHQPGDEFSLGKTEIECNCTDMSGAIGQCFFDIIVVDVTSPIAECPVTQIVNATQDSNYTKAVVTWNLASCSDNSQMDVPLTCIHQSGTEFGLGNTTINCYCTDDAGNTGQCFFNIVVQDETSPTVSCPAELSVNADYDGNTKAVVMWDLPSCSDNSHLDLRIHCTHQSGTTLRLGNTTVQCNCTDSSGNTDQCTFHVIVKDVTSPTANCPAEQIVNANLDDNTTAVVSWNLPSCSDNSRADVRLYCNHHPGTKFALGNTTKVSLRKIKTFLTIFWKFHRPMSSTDVTSPSASCPANLIEKADYDGNTKSVVTWSDPLCSDNSQSDIRLECTHQPGSEFGLGNTTVQCNCTDMSENTDQCFFYIFVKDVTSPTASCPSTQVANANYDGNTKAVVSWTLPTCSDNSKTVVLLDCTPQPGTEFGLGNTTVQCSCTDGSGNIGQCSFFVTVKDITSPTASCPPTQVANANYDGNTKAVVSWTVPTCSDNSKTNVPLDCTPQPGTEFGLGNTTVQCSCSDGSGNIGQCSFFVTVQGRFI